MVRHEIQSQVEAGDLKYLLLLVVQNKNVTLTDLKIIKNHTNSCI